MDSETFTVEAPLRLDLLLVSRYPERSRTYFQEIIINGGVTLNGEIAKKRTIPQIGDLIAVRFPPVEEIALVPENIPLNILFEDEHLIAVHKPAGMVVHPAPGHPTGTFVNALLYHCKNISEVGEEHRPGIVHRLDKDTSGVLLAAKTRIAHEKLTELFAKREMQKEYLAICVGNPGAGVIDKPIGRHHLRRKEMAITEKGKEAITEFETLSFEEPFSLVRLKPKTGRTHQIRVHLQSLGTPVFGDRTYGFEKMNTKHEAPRMMLHAHRLTFIHPFTGEKISLEASSEFPKIKSSSIINTYYD
ncbi:MAG: RluA family pseudouridine synthase [Candidatus Algichlamydia australiensis]|nr:RluA family pseudouridine synthase [Chlamydiales bacterium]